MRVSSAVVRITLRAMVEDSDRCMDSDCVNDISNTTDSPQKKKRRLSDQHFLPAYTAEWPAVVRSKLDPFHAHCTLCQHDFSVRHGGRFDIQRHLKTAKHLSYKVLIESTQPIGEFFSKGNVKYSKIVAT